MTDTKQTASPTAPPATPGRGLKIALAVSVALNLAVVGLVGGMILHGGPGMRGDMMVRDMGFGPFDGALLPEDRDALRKQIQGRFGDIRAARQQMQADGVAILAAMRAEPFDPAALSAALDAQAEHLGARLEFGSTMIRDYLLALPDQARREFADRLEQRMRNGRDGERDKDGD